MDTTGCGDAFDGEFIVAPHHRMNTEITLCFAQASAELVATGLVSDTGIVSFDRTMEMMRCWAVSSGSPARYKPFALGTRGGDNMERMGHVIRLKPEVIAEYKRIHAAVWPEVLEAIAASNIRNYTIFLKEPENLLFAYWEYHGTNFAADLARMAEALRMRELWHITDPMQAPFETRNPGEWWARMEDVFHTG